jgi:hypothetical protein
MKTLTGICTVLVMFGLLSLCSIATAQEDTSGTVLTDDIAPYNGPIGADSPLYGLKIALEDMDESFTTNETERVDKQMDHARLRLSEVRRSLELNQSDSAEQALNNYWLKMNLTNTTISQWGLNATGLLHAQEMVVRHQFVLEHLLETHPNNTGLQRAYNNSIRLEEKFGEKTMIRFNRTMEKNNQTILKAIHLEQKEHDRNGWPDVTTQPTVNETQQQQTEQEKNQNRKPTVTMQQQQGTSAQPTVTKTQVQQTEQEENRNKNQGTATPVSVTTQQQNGNQQDGNNDNKGKGSSKNT